MPINDDFLAEMERVAQTWNYGHRTMGYHHNLDRGHHPR